MIDPVSQRAKEIYKFIAASSEYPTFGTILNSGIDGSRSTLRFALCELIDIGCVKPTRVKASTKGFQVVYEIIDENDPTQESFWK